MVGLETDGGRLARHPLVVVTKTPQVAIDGRGGQRAWRQLLESIRRFDTMLDQQLKGAHRREMPTLLLVVLIFMAAMISHQRSTSAAGNARGWPRSARWASFGRRSPRSRRYSVARLTA